MIVAPPSTTTAAQHSITYPLELPRHRESHRARLHRMEMDVLDRRRLARQLRFVEVGDVVLVTVEDVEDGCAHLQRVADVIARFEVDQRGRLRLDAAILDQGSFAEVAKARAAEPAARMIDSDADGRNVLDRAGNAVAGGIVAGEAR